MKFFLIAVCPYDDNQEVWIPYWLRADDPESARAEGKAIAWNLYSASRYDLERFKFRLFRTDYPLPLDLEKSWLIEFRKLTQTR